MSQVTLTSEDVRRLEAAMTTLLSPLQYPDLPTWGEAVLRDCRALVEADQGMLAHALDGSVAMQAQGARAQEALRAYAEHYHRVDPGMTERRPALGLTTYHRDMLYDRRELPRTALYQEWCVPHRLLDKVGMCADGWAGVPGEAGPEGGVPIDAGALPPVVHLFHDRDGSADGAAHSLALLRLLLPAFRAGARSVERFGRRRAELAAVFDSAAEGLLAVDVAGNGVYHNPALAALLAADPEGATLLAIAHDMAAAASDVAHPSRRRGKSARNGGGAAGVAPAAREVVTAMTRYRLRVTALAEGLLARLPVAVVALERLTSPLPTTAELMARYGLTSREAEVGLLLVQAQSNDEIARSLGVTAHTARRHTERVLAKLGVHSRATAAVRLRER